MELLMEKDTQAVAALDPDRLRLLKARLGSLFDWKRPAIIESVGPFMPEAFDRFENELQDIIAKCCAQLNRYTDEQVTNILTLPKDGATYTRSWADFLINDVYYLGRSVPEWHSGGFGHPDHVADFKYWAKMPAFDLGELTCLSVGISPAEFPKRKLMEMSRSKERQKFSRAIEFLVLRFELLQRTFDPYSHNTGTASGSFLAWVDRFQEDVHSGFLEPLRNFQRKAVTAVAAPVHEKTDKREVDSVAQLFTAMAIEQFGYVPDAPRSPITKEIASLAASLGISITEETILKYLRIGATYISPDWKPHER